MTFRNNARIIGLEIISMILNILVIRRDRLFTPLRIWGFA